MDDIGPTLLGMVLIAVLTLVLIVAAIGGAVYFVERKTCARTAAAMDRPYRFDFFAGCLVGLADGRFVPLDTYRLTEEGE